MPDEQETVMPRMKRRDNEADQKFAAKATDLTDPRDARYMRSVTATTRTQSARGWQWYRDIGEIHYAITRNAKVAGYANLTVVKRNADGTPGDPIKGGFENDILNLLSSPYGGVRGFVERYFTMMKIPGDSYLIRCRDSDGDVEGYDWLSADEIDAASLGSNGIGTDRDRVFKAGEAIERVILPASANSGTQLTVPVEARDFIGRSWRPAGQYVALADSPMRSLDTQCEILHLLTTNIRAKLLSRFALNGILFVPSEIADVRSGAPKGESGEQFHENSVLDRLISAATWAVQNHMSPEAAVPIFLTGPGNYGDMIKHITYDRDIMETDMKLRAELIDRILTGLDTQPSGVTGMGDNNHWSAWASTDEDRRVNVVPDVEMMCWALTRLVLHREMQAAGLKPGRIVSSMIWYDLSAAAAKTNMAEDGRQARDRILISDSAARRTSGLTEADAPSDEEYVRMVGVKMKDPYLATFGMAIVDQIDWEKVGSVGTGPTEDSPQVNDSKVGPGVGDPGSPNNATKSAQPTGLRTAS
jgi:hypothetical protein